MEETEGQDPSARDPRDGVQDGGGRVFDMPSGAKLRVSVAAYEDVMGLHDAVLAELRGRGMGALDVASVQAAFMRVSKAKADAEAGKPAEPWDGEAAKASDEGLNVLVDRAMAVLSSKEVKAALFACAQKAVYMADGTERTALRFQVGKPGYGVFDHPNARDRARADFYEICAAVARENLRPFGTALFSMFAALLGNRAVSPKSSSVPA